MFESFCICFKAWTSDLRTSFFLSFFLFFKVFQEIRGLVQDCLFVFDLFRERGQNFRELLVYIP